MSASLQQVGFVIIGRNEGERLKEGLRSIVSLCEQSPVVYVDSGSDDDSVAFAQSLNVMVVELDLSTPFTAARARNAGFDLLMEKHADLQYVQFLDGDCKLMPGWVEAAIETLEANDDIGIASGRRQEKFPEASIYNELIDLEWNSPIGVALGVPGDMCVKVPAFKAIEGFSADMIAGEDFDFCLRALQAGFKTYRVDALMSMHDADIMHLSQWYKRIKRGGHAYANLYHRYKHTPEKYYFKQVRSALIWGALVPFLIILLCFISPLLSGVLLVGYLAFAAKSIKYQLDKGHSLKLAIIYGTLVFSGKFYEVLGIFQYAKNQFLSRKHVLIEYK